MFVKKLAANPESSPQTDKQLPGVAQINQTVRKTALDSDIKDHLISRELRFQKATIENRLIK